MADTAVGPQMQALLTRYGLGGLAGWLSGRIVANISAEQIMLELYDRPEFKAAFPEIEARRALGQKTGTTLAPISPEDVLQYRTQAKELMRAYGVPAGMYSQNADFFDLIVNDVSMDELNRRLEMASTRVAAAAPEVRSIFSELYGANGDTALFSLFVDEEKAVPVLEDMVQKAEAGGAARRFGFDIQESTMNRLAGLNVDYGQAVEGFGQLDVVRGLLDESIYEDEDYTVDEEGTEAVFAFGEGRSKLERRAGERKASTSGAAGGLIEERGATGLGGAGRR